MNTPEYIAVKFLAGFAMLALFAFWFYLYALTELYNSDHFNYFGGKSYYALERANNRLKKAKQLLRLAGIGALISFIACIVTGEFSLGF